MSQGSAGLELEPRTRSALEWDLLLERLATRCESLPGRGALARLEPATTLEEAQLRVARLRDALELDDRGQPLPRADFPELGDLFARLRIGSVASGRELYALCRVLVQAHVLRHYARAHRELRPALAMAITSPGSLDELQAKLDNALEADGTLADRASPGLAAARAKVREVEAEIKRRLAKLVSRYADLLQEQYYTERDGRHVLPVRADAHLRVPGIVLGSSASGATLYVEPSELTELGNRLRVLEAEVEREEARVLAELSEQTRAVADDAALAFEVCVRADVLGALARWAAETSSHPVALVAEARLELERARHPLLLLSGIDVVPNDLRIQGGRALVISGPNAGGKTVALKTLGLVAMMARAGIPLPVGADSVVGWFDRVLAEVGDEQSIVRSLSTFSAHVQNLCEVLQLAGPHTLILLDELAAGTDPEEGAALASAVLEALTARGAAAVVTTHYERLKELAAHAPHLENASVSFDFAKMAPTFRLTLGVPGASSALLVARRHGLPQAVIERAQALLPKESVDREQALSRLESERTALEAERAELARQTEELAARRADFERESEAEREALHTEIQREASSIRAIVLKARGELERARRSLREQGLDADRFKQAERSVSRVAGQVAVGGELFEKGQPPEPPARSVDVRALDRGQVVRIKSIGALATVSEVLEAGNVRLVAGSMKLTLPASELELAPAGTKPERREKKPSQAKRAILAAPLRTEDNTLDLRGVRVEDAEARIDAFLDRMLGEGEPAGFILHGHGTGALKLAVRAHLAASSYVEHSRAADPDAGGDAFTVFWIKD